MTTSRLLAVLVTGLPLAQAQSDTTAWLAQAQATAGNVTASNNGGPGWTFDGTAGVDYDFGSLDALDGKPVDGSTVEFLINLGDSGPSISIAAVGGWSPGSEVNQFKVEQWNNTGKFGITLEAIADYQLTTDSIFNRDLHVVFVRNADGTMDFYLNGAFVETHTDKTNWRMDGGPGKLGSRSNGTTDVADGDIYGVASYDTALGATEIAALYEAFHPTIEWGGTNADWVEPTAWVGGAVPATDGTNSARISSGTVNYAAELGDLTFTGNSRLLVDGGTFAQSTAEWLRFQAGGSFAVTNGGSLTKPGRLRIWRSAGNLVSNGTVTVGQLQVDDNADLTLDTGATVSAVDSRALVNNNSVISVTAATLNLASLDLGAFGGNATFIDLFDGAILNLDAAGLGTPGDVITIAGDSHVNFAAGSTGSVFIDNIGATAVQAMIADGKFGIDRVRVLTPAGFSLTAQGAGIVITPGTPPPPSLRVLGFSVDGFLVIEATNLDPSMAYDLVRGGDLQSFPDFVDNRITGVTSYQFIDNGNPDGLPTGTRAFYRLEELPAP